MKQNTSFKKLQIEPNSQYIVGIDSGTENGICLYNYTKQEYTDLFTISFWELIELLNRFNRLDIVCIIEDIISNKPTFHKGMIFKAIASKNKIFIGQAVGTFDKIAQDVGGSKRDQKHLEEYLQQYSIPYILRVPKKNSKTKLDKEEFEKHTGISCRSNEHTRDACMLIHNYLKTLQSHTEFSEIVASIEK